MVSIESLKLFLSYCVIILIKFASVMAKALAWGKYNWTTQFFNSFHLLSRYNLRDTHNPFRVLRYTLYQEAGNKFWH